MKPTENFERDFAAEFSGPIRHGRKTCVRYRRARVLVADKGRLEQRIPAAGDIADLAMAPASPLARLLGARSGGRDVPFAYRGRAGRLAGIA
jgi:hypothetical protein